MFSRGALRRSRRERASEREGDLDESEGCSRGLRAAGTSALSSRERASEREGDLDESASVMLDRAMVSVSSTHA